MLEANSLVFAILLAVLALGRHRKAIQGIVNALFNFSLAFLLLFLVTFFSAKEIHPYHVGSVEFKYRAASTHFELSAKFFLDDL